MLKSMFDNTSLPLLQKVAAYTERRHDILAGNVANISTPGYQTRDLPVEEFQAALKQAAARIRSGTAGTGPGGNPTGASPASASANPGPRSLEDLFPKEMYHPVISQRTPLTYQDGNNRNVESEVMELTKNSMLQNLSIELLVSQMARLQTVISERA